MRYKLLIIDLDSQEFAEEFDLPKDNTIWAYTTFGDEDSDAQYIIFMDKEKCDEGDCYVQVLAHEFAHVLHAEMGIEDTEDEADDCAYDWCAEAGDALDVFHEWAVYNQM